MKELNPQQLKEVSGGVMLFPSSSTPGFYLLALAPGEEFYFVDSLEQSYSFMPDGFSAPKNIESLPYFFSGSDCVYKLPVSIFNIK